MGANTKPFHTPDWVKSATFYQIFPDSFAIGAGSIPMPWIKGEFLQPWNDPPTLRGFKGGNLWGVIEKLDYIKESGFDAIYFCPVFSSPANHRYHTTDYFQIDPLLGGNEAFDALLEAAHAKGIRVVLDAVFNHSSRAHYAFAHVLQNEEQSPYRDWYHIKGFPLHAYDDTQPPNYHAWWDIRELPKFNTSNHECREYLLGVAEFWMHKGIDGWRLDVPNEIDDDSFWQEFRRRVKAINPEAYIVGEIWNDASRWLQGDQFDAVMNYPLSRAVLGFVGSGAMNLELAKPSGLHDLEHLNALACSHRFEQLFERYCWESVCCQMNILTSHDTPRIFSLFNHHVERTALALGLLFVLPGVPTVYYGDEIGLEGAHDPDNRRGMLWNGEQWQGKIHHTIRRLSELRRNHTCLHKGSYKRVYASGRHLAFLRDHEGESLLITINAGPDLWQLNVNADAFARKGDKLESLTSGAQATMGSHHIHAQQDPFSIEIWQLRA